ncbi:UNVERIFIED_CONTAM: hypothetical protein HDU68_005599 [Siphonaria sp. JEL0065]|nr:hypothetical protein HDU68_005599 [Siphonaria sp. JEL0065]
MILGLVLCFLVLVPFVVPRGWAISLARRLSVGSGNGPNKIYFGTTRHVRLRPRRHGFSFGVVSAGVRVDVPTANSVFFGIDVNWALLSIHASDYLDNSDNPLEVKVRTALASANVTHQIGRIELITAPRFFGFRSFNPLNVYYCFDKQDDSLLRVTLLEVNNTFGERHLYVCDERNRWNATKQGFHSSYTLDRSFFVSPFNNRSGIYETHIARVTHDKMGVLLIVKDYIPDKNELESDSLPAATSNDKKQTSAVLDNSNIKENELKESSLPKHLIASVEGISVPLTPLTVLCLLYFHPFTVFLTLPRIMSEAWKIAYIKKLGIYQKPNPRRTATEAGLGTTILPLPESSFDAFCRLKVLQHLAQQCQHHSRTLYITLLDKSTIQVTSTGHHTIVSNDEVDPKYPHIHLLSPYLFTRIIVDFNNPARALATTFLSGEWSAFRKQDVAEFLYLLQRTDASPKFHKKANNKQLSHSSRLAIWFNRCYHSDSKQPSSSFPPFSSCPTTTIEFEKLWKTSILDIEGDPIIAKRVFWGTLEIWLSEAAFRAVTKFIVDPYAVASRVETMYSRSTKSVVGSMQSGIDEDEAFVRKGWCEERVGLLLGEMDDDVDAVVRERVRYEILRGVS